jgi:hypothetical protein
MAQLDGAPARAVSHQSALTRSSRHHYPPCGKGGEDGGPRHRSRALIAVTQSHQLSLFLGACGPVLYSCKGGERGEKVSAS